MEQQTASKSGEEYVKAVYCHPAYLTHAEYIMRNARLDEAQPRIKIAWRNINNLRYADVLTYLYILKTFNHKTDSQSESRSVLLDSCVDSENYSIASKGFLPTVVDIMVI